MGVVVVTFLSIASPAFAAGPTVETGSTSNVFSDTAIVGGTVDPNGLPLTSCEFTVGIDPTLTVDTSTEPCYESKLEDGDIGASAVLTGLHPLTTYYVKLTAATTLGSSSGATTSFMTTDTPPPPPTATTDSASAVDNTSATLNGAVDAENVAISNCEFQYGTDTSYGQIAPCSPTPQPESGSQAVSAALAGLTATTYHYRVVITTEGGTTDGADETFTPAVVGAATTGSATDITATSATLGGSVDTQGQAGDSCYFLYGTGTGAEHQSACAPVTIPASGTQNETAAVTQLLPQTRYSFEIVLATPDGEIAGAAGSFTTLPGPVVATHNATLITASTARLNGVVNAEGSAIVTCVFQYSRNRFAAGSDSPSDGTSAPCSPRPGDDAAVAVAAPIKGLSASTAYYFRVLLQTQAGTVVGGTLSFRAHPRTPGVKIRRVRISAKHRTATLYFSATGVRATRYDCALLVVKRNGKVGRIHYKLCKSPRTYRKLAKRRYEFIVRAGNAAGWGAASMRRFKL